jgi:phosphatidylserine/phosphatidylglycerophosphate/cardiolipin synthase-like enzyme
LNEELNVVTYDRAVAARLEAIFNEDLGHAEPVTYERWKDRGLKARLVELVAIPLRDQF